MTMTQSEFYAALQDLHRRAPNEMLLPTIEEAGYGKIGIIYLKAALERLPEEVHEDDLPEEQDEPERDDEKWNELTRSIRMCYNEVRRVHNLYHECKTEEDYKSNAIRMRGAWEATLHAINARKAYEQGGYSIEDTEELPENPVALSLMLSSLRVKRTQHQKKITELATKGDKDGLQKKEASLLNIKNKIGIVEQRLAQLKQDG
jgi:hypothetical protein